MSSLSETVVFAMSGPLASLPFQEGARLSRERLMIHSKALRTLSFRLAVLLTFGVWVVACSAVVLYDHGMPDLD